MCKSLEQSGRFPLIGGSSISWEAAKKAHRFYVSLYGNVQTLEEIAGRGGFHIFEFCIFYLGLPPFKSRNEKKQHEIVARVASMLGDQWRFDREYNE